MNKSLIARIDALETHGRRLKVFLIHEDKIGHEAARAEIARIEKESERLGIEPICIVFD